MTSAVQCLVAWSLDQVHVDQPLKSLQLGSPRQQEGVHLHGVDGHREGLLHLHTIVHQGQRHLFDICAEQLGEHFIQADLPSVRGAGHAERSVGSGESLSVKHQGGLVGGRHLHRGGEGGAEVDHVDITGQVLLHGREGVLQVVALVVLQAEDESEERIEQGVPGSVAQQTGVARGGVGLHRGPGYLSLQQQEEMVWGHLVVLHSLEEAPVVVLEIHYLGLMQSSSK